jgi:hypothetical protein
MSALNEFSSFVYQLYFLLLLGAIMTDLYYESPSSKVQGLALGDPRLWASLTVRRECTAGRCGAAAGRLENNAARTPPPAKQKAATKDLLTLCLTA